MNSTSRIFTITSGLGSLAGLYFAYKKQYKFQGYVGMFFLGTFVGSILGSIINASLNK
jgi:hypothetical protein